MCHEMLQVQWMCSLIHVNANTFATKCLAIASNQWICVKTSLHISLLFIPLFLLELFCSAVPFLTASSTCLHCTPNRLQKGWTTSSSPAQWYFPPKALLFTHTDSCSSLSQCSWLERSCEVDSRKVNGNSVSGRDTLLVQHGAVHGVFLSDY